jgi:hypothetical protein
MAGNIIAYYSLKQLSAKGKQLLPTSWGLLAHTNCEIAILQIISSSSQCIICHPVVIILSQVATKDILFCLPTIDLCYPCHTFHNIIFEKAHTCCRYKGWSEINKGGKWSRGNCSETGWDTRVDSFFFGANWSTWEFWYVLVMDKSFVEFWNIVEHPETWYPVLGVGTRLLKKGKEMRTGVGSWIMMKDSRNTSCLDSPGSRNDSIAQIEKHLMEATHITWQQKNFLDGYGELPNVFSFQHQKRSFCFIFRICG